MNWYKLHKFSWYKKAKKEECTGWMAVELDKSLSKKIIDWGKKNIPDDILYKKEGFGRELESHITLMYGICTDKENIIKEMLKDQKPIKAELDKISYFSKDEDYDVVIIKIKSKDLEELNEKIDNILKIEKTFDDYKPHCTIAYVKKGEAKKFSGINIFEGEKIVFKNILFEDYNNKKTTIRLN